MKAIIPIAGLGTRMLPLTKVIPKAMLPVHDRPCVQWIVEELEAAGIKEIIFITSKGQESVQEYFTHKTWYDEELEARGKTEQAKRLEAIRNLAKFHFVEQPEPLGDGHAILQAKSLIDSDESFLVIFGDCLYSGDEVVKKMREAHEQTQLSIIAVQKIEPEKAQNYGIVSKKSDSNPFPIDSMVEKPSQHHPQLPTTDYGLQAPLAIIGRYLLKPSIWRHLEAQHSASGEIRLIDALQSLQKQQEVFGLQLKGTWLDTGSLEGLWEASMVLKDL